MLTVIMWTFFFGGICVPEILYPDFSQISGGGGDFGIWKGDLSTCYPQVLMQVLMTFYVVILNVILSRSSDEAVTILRLYYKGGILSQDLQTIKIGGTAFRIIGLNFIPAVFSLVFPIYFQAIGKVVSSAMLSIARQTLCLIPVFWGLPLTGLDHTWFAFSVAEPMTGTVGVILYSREQ